MAVFVRGSIHSGGTYSALANHVLQLIQIINLNGIFQYLQTNLLWHLP
jgi:hypothetical protein